MLPVKLSWSIGALSIILALTGCDLGGPDEAVRDNPWDAHNPNPPRAPINLTITPYAWNNILLRWVDQSGNENGFVVEHKVGFGGNWSKLTVRGANQTACQDNGLRSNTTYSYRVKAFNDSGFSGYTNEVTFMTPDTTLNPIADFTWTGATVTPAQITFQNRSQNADSYLWNFGGGRTSTQVSPTINFTSYGQFTISLTASFTATSRTNTVRKALTITPGKINITYVAVDAIPSILDWDLATGPDLFFNLNYPSGGIASTSSVVLDVVSSDLPIIWTYNGTGFNVTDWSGAWSFQLFDEDDFDPNDLIGTTSFRINSLVSARGYVGSYSLSSGSLRMRIGVTWE